MSESKKRYFKGEIEDAAKTYGISVRDAREHLHEIDTQFCMEVGKGFNTMKKKHCITCSKPMKKASPTGTSCQDCYERYTD